MREKMARFMSGRYGSDELNRFISLLGCVLLVLSLFIRIAAPFLWALAVAGLVWCYYRTFSKNLTKRREENAKFLSAREEVRAYFRGARERRGQSREYKFFRCPSCKTMLRVPRGKGKIKVVCRKCGNSFIKKS